MSGREEVSTIQLWGLMQRFPALYVHGSNPKVSCTSASDVGTRTKPGTLQCNRLLGCRAEIFPARENIDSEKGKWSKSKQLNAT